MRFLTLAVVASACATVHPAARVVDYERPFDPIQLDHESADTTHDNECSGGWAYPFVDTVPGSGGAIKTWSTGETLTSTDLNANFAHIHSNMVGGHGGRLVDADVNAAAAISTSKLAAKSLIPVAWASMTYGSACAAGTCGLQASSGITSITYFGASAYTVTMSTTRTDTSYAVIAMGQVGVVCYFNSASAPTATTFRVACTGDTSFDVMVFDNN